MLSLRPPESLIASIVVHNNSADEIKSSDPYRNNSLYFASLFQGIPAQDHKTVFCAVPQAPYLISKDAAWDFHSSL